MPQTLADLGWVGLGLSLLALVLWGWARGPRARLRPRDRGLPWDAERVGMAALVAVALVFGVHSAVDWTWFVPANALCGLIAAAWVVARPPLRTRMEAAYEAPRPPAAAPARARAAPLWAPPAPEEPPPAADVAGPGALPVADAAWRRRAPFPWPALAAALLVLALAFAAAWTAIQPRARRATRATWRSSGCSRATSTRRSRSRGSRTTATRSRPSRCGSSATSRSSAAGWPTPRRRYEEAVRVQPANAETWRRLGRFQLSSLNQPADALASFRAAYFLDPRNPASTSDFLEASRANGAAGGDCRPLAPDGARDERAGAAAAGRRARAIATSSKPVACSARVSERRV